MTPGGVNMHRCLPRHEEAAPLGVAATVNSADYHEPQLQEHQHLMVTIGKPGTTRLAFT